MSQCIIWTSWLLMAVAVTAESPPPEPAQVIDHWDTRDGLPVNQVVRLLQSHDGYLWMATFDGLVRFDGVRFEKFRTDRYPGLPSNRLTNLLEASDGSLWMVTEQGFGVRFQDGVFRHLGPEDGLSGHTVHAMTDDSQGRIWLTSDDGISVYDGQALAPFEPEKVKGPVDRILVQRDGTVWYRQHQEGKLYRFENGVARVVQSGLDTGEFLPMFEDRDGAVWYATGTDVHAYRDGKTRLVASLGNSASEVSSIGQNLAGTIWVATFDTGFYALGSHGPQHFEPSRGEIHAYLRSFHTDANGRFWKFASHGVWRDDERIAGIDGSIATYVFDREGNLWLGTDNQGLFRIKSSPFSVFGGPEGLENPNIYPVLEDREGSIWVGSYGAGVARISGGAVHSAPVEGMSDSSVFVLSLQQTADGAILAGLLNDGVLEREAGREAFSRMSLPPELQTASVYAIHEQHDGTLWLGTDSGAFRRPPGQDDWLPLELPSTSAAHPVRYFLDGPDGSLWMATNGGGILRFTEGRTEVFDRAQGFPSNLVRSLFVETGATADDHVLWVGSEDRGLIRLEVQSGRPRMDTLTIYDTAAGMLDIAVHVILADQSSAFWLNTNRGIFKVAREQLEAFHQGEVEAVQGVFYDEAEGLRNREGNGGVQSPGVRASDGSLWFAGQAGVVRIDPERIPDNEVVPPVVIETLQTTHRSLRMSPGAPVHLEANERDFEIHFTGLSLTAPQKNAFRYRLVGYSDKWNDAGGRRVAAYTNIPPGQYRFEVSAANNTGLWNSEPAVAVINIAPLFYETGWFRALISTLVVAVLLAGVRLRIRALERHKLALKQQVNERTDQLRQSQRKSQQQADQLRELDRTKSHFFANISHEFRTPLTLIMSQLQQMLSARTSRRDAGERLQLERMLSNSERLLRLIDQMLDLSKMEHGQLELHVSEIDLNEFLETITGLFDPVCKEKEIRLALRLLPAPCTVYADFNMLDKIIANLLSNAVKFTPPGGSIRVEAIDSGDQLIVRVSDTGIGVPPEDLSSIFDRFYQVDSSATRGHEGSGIGLALAREMAELHHGSLVAQSEPGKGSTFELTLRKGCGHFSDAQLNSGDTATTAAQYPEPVDESEIADVNGEAGQSEADDRTTVLVVDDNADMRCLVREVLGDAWQVLEAGNGIEGLEQVSASLPDLIIADIMMPEMDGMEFNRRLKSDPASAAIPIIFLTARAGQQDRLAGYAEDADAYISKPFDPELLRARVDNLIRSRWRLRELLATALPDDTAVDDQTSTDDPFLLKVQSIVGAHYTDPDFKAGDLPAKLYVSRSKLHRELKTRTGLSAAAFIRKYRLETAARLLADKAGNISEIAYAVGYKSLAHFSDAFRQYHGTSPSAHVG